jgi:hypothetical protein
MNQTNTTKRASAITQGAQQLKRLRSIATAFRQWNKINEWRRQKGFSPKRKEVLLIREIFNKSMVLHLG